MSERVIKPKAVYTQDGTLAYPWYPPEDDDLPIEDELVILEKYIKIKKERKENEL